MQAFNPYDSPKERSVGSQSPPLPQSYLSISLFAGICCIGGYFAGLVAWLSFLHAPKDSVDLGPLVIAWSHLLFFVPLFLLTFFVVAAHSRSAYGTWALPTGTCSLVGLLIGGALALIVLLADLGNDFASTLKLLTELGGGLGLPPFVAGVAYDLARWFRKHFFLFDE